LELSPAGSNLKLTLLELANVGWPDEQPFDDRKNSDPFSAIAFWTFAW
jgi:hypothetical protein